jgi:hypothetical protein
MNWFPNAHGLLWFISNVWPVIKKKRPGAVLHITGHGTPNGQLLKAINDRNDVLFVGEEEDELPRFREARCFIVPLWIAAGARVKVLHAWAAGVPVVATTIGAEGLPFVDGDNLLIADTAQAFAANVVKVLGDPDVSQRLAANGRRLVEEEGSSCYAAAQLHEFYNELGVYPIREHIAPQSETCWSDGTAQLLLGLLQWKTDADELISRLSSKRIGGEPPATSEFPTERLNNPSPGIRGLASRAWHSLRHEGLIRFIWRVAQPWEWIRKIGRHE